MQPTRTVHVAVYDTLADWEVGHTIAHLRNGFAQRRVSTIEVKTVGITGEPVVTSGGMRILPDLALADLDPADSALLILPGADTWLGTDGPLVPVAKAARAFLDAGVPVAAICGAVAGLAIEGLLDDRQHTGADKGFLAMTGYAGGEHYVEADACTADNVITAGPTEPVAFAREIFALFDIYQPEVLDAWYRLFANSDPAAYGVLAAAEAAKAAPAEAAR